MDCQRRLTIVYSAVPSSHRYSVASTSETYNSGGGTGENNALFRQSQSFSTMSPYDPTNISQLALPPGRGVPMGRDPSPASTESGGEPASYPVLQREDSEQLSQFSPNLSSTNSEHALISPSHYSSPTPVYAEPDAMMQQNQATSRNRQPSAHGRGVSLVDSGPVPVAPHDPVRRVSRHVRRQSSRNQLANSNSGNVYDPSLPPGAVSDRPSSRLQRSFIGLQAPPQY